MVQTCGWPHGASLSDQHHWLLQVPCAIVVCYIMPVAAVPDADEDEEGEVQDAQVTAQAEAGEAAPDNMQVRAVLHHPVSNAHHL